MIHTNGDTYSGEIVNNKAHGFGIKIDRSQQNKYIGYWIKNKHHGFGKQNCSDGS